MQHHAAAARRRDRHFHVARHILPEIDHALAFRRNKGRNGVDLFLFPYPLAHLRDEFGGYLGAHRAAEFDDRGGLVHGLAVVDLGKGDLARAHFPTLVGGDRFFRSVGKEDIEPRQQGNAVGKVMVVAVNADIAHGPALPHAEGKKIVGGKQPCHIIGLHLHALFVTRPAGRQHRVADARAVEKGHVNAHRRGAQSRFFHGLAPFHGKLFFKRAGRRVRVAGGGDPNGAVLHALSLSASVFNT